MFEDFTKWLRIIGLFSKFTSFEFDTQHRCIFNQTINGQITVPNFEPGLRGGQLNLVRYVMCKLNLGMVFVEGSCDDLNISQNTQFLCMINYKFHQEHAENTRYVSFGQEYMTELLSVLKYQDDQRTFSPYKLFSNLIWLIFMIDLVLLSLFMYHFTIQHYTTTQWLHYFFKFFVNQSSKTLKIISKNKWTAFLLIMISMLCISSLTKCFTSSLLMTFFRVKPHLTVNTLEEIVDNPGLFVAGMRGLEEVINFKPQIFAKLENRIKEYEKSLDINSINIINLGSTRLIKDVQDGKAVILIDTFTSAALKLMHPSFDLMESNYKYNQNFFYIYVTKNHTKSHEIYKMMRFQYELGISNRDLKVFFLSVEVYAKTDPELIFNDSNENMAKPIDVYQMFKAHNFCLHGHLLALTVFVMEILAYSVRKFVSWLKY